MKPLSQVVAGIDVHPHLLMVVVGAAGQDEATLVSRKFATTRSALRELVAWLRGLSVDAVVMVFSRVNGRAVYTESLSRGRDALASGEASNGLVLQRGEGELEDRAHKVGFPLAHSMAHGLRERGLGAGQKRVYWFGLWQLGIFS